MSLSPRPLAFASHLLLSCGAATGLLAALLGWWYPAPYFWIDGGWQGLRLVMAVDVVIGPLLTALVFDKSKGTRKLVFDLTVIGVLQICAMAGGVWTVYSQRTLLVVFSDGAFYTLDPGTVDSLGSRATALVDRGPKTPVLAVLRLPSGEALQQARREALQTRTPLYRHAEWLERLDGGNFQLLEAYDLNLAKWSRESRGRDVVVERFRRRFGALGSGVVVVPAHARFGSLLMVFQRHTGEFVGAVDASPAG